MCKKVTRFGSHLTLLFRLHENFVEFLELRIGSPFPGVTKFGLGFGLGFRLVWGNGWG